ncbi:MAG: hypothetical protein ACJAU5_000629 [Maricaulis maris]|jgi:hypothetical protein
MILAPKGKVLRAQKQEKPDAAAGLGLPTLEAGLHHPAI